MGATAFGSNATLESVLKEFYVKAIAEQLNQEVLALEMFEKAKLDWSGKRVVVPVHLARNSGVGFADEGGVLPTAGNQTYEDLTVTAKFLYGRFQITGPAISAAKGAYSFGNYIDLELRKLVDDVRKQANVGSIHGNGVKGYVTFAGTIAAAGGGAAVVQAMTYHGNADQISDILTGLAAGESLRVIALRADTYAETIKVAEATVDLEMEVTAIDTATNTIVLANPTGSTTGWDSRRSTVANAGLRGRPVPLRFFITTGAGGGAAVSDDFTKEFTGVCHNLSSKSHFTVDRNVTANAALRSPGVLSMQEGAVDAVYNAPVTLTLAKLQKCMDTISSASSMEPDVMMINPLTRQQYTSLLTGTTAGNLYKSTDSAKGGDGGFRVESLGFNGTPFKTSVDCGKGSIFFLSTKVWKCAQLESPGFANLDGNILARAGIGTGGVDAYEGYYRMYMDIYCERPNANGCLVGIPI